MRASRSVSGARLRRLVAVALTAALLVLSLPASSFGIEVSSIKGQVTVEGGSPLSGVEVGLYKWVADGEGGSWVQVTTTTTNGDGVYNFYGLDPRAYTVCFSHTGFITQYFDGQYSLESATPVLYEGTQVTGIDAVLGPDNPSLSGRITDSEGAGLEGIKVKIFKYTSPGFEWVDYVWTGPEGEWAAYGLEPGAYKLWFYDYEGTFLNEYYNNVGTLEAAQTLYYEGTGLTGLDAQLARKVAQVSGTATDSVTGEPVAGVWAKLYRKTSTGFDFVQCVETDALGRFWFYGVTGGTYTVRFLDENSADGLYAEEYWADKESLETATTFVFSGTPVTNINEDLVALPASISGTVTDEAGAGLPGIYVKVYREMGGPTPYGGTYWEWVTYSQTTEDGSYTVFGLDPGMYRIRFFDGEAGQFVEEYYNDAATLETASNVEFSGTKLEGINASLVRAARISGETRYDTACDIAYEGFPGWEGIDTVIIASGDDRAAADPLAASGLCWLYDAPLLLVSSTRTPAEVKEAVAQIVAVNGPVKIRVVGGAGSVPSARISEIENYVEGAFGDTSLVTWGRVASEGNRYELSRRIVEEMKYRAAAEGKTLPTSALMANGADQTKFFDALAMSPIAAQNGTPVLLTAAGELPRETYLALRSLQASGVTEVIVGGGPSSVGDGVMTTVQGMGFTTERWAGATRYDTAVTIANNALARGWVDDKVAGVAAKLPDALAGGSMIGMRSGVLLLTAPTSLPSATNAWLEAHDTNVTDCYLFGGTGSLAPAVKDKIQATLK